ncbi:tRNA lysidine(34) synthetase TilS [Galbibacter mesophilus]|uniref:tRNA lysidine(34) synthetase TilS n=1 Tax=Galbibacter mesophilus TaxID=379069 RepID=UPI00191F5FA9|nr:tRNA lysidine(34) synthetase TilS [Galbibacter mesophilus]MCM5663297.1 tRNA lysidine(34) synthetase TilS [Galbibacter mesophilus]
MLEKFRTHIERKFPFFFESKIAIASSGGIDSMVLTHLCQQLEINICVLHCNFQLRGEESDRDKQFLQQYLEKEKIPFYATDFDTNTYAEKNKVSTQIAARELRYKWFEEQKKLLQFDYLLTGHHADDNLETFLINLTRGTGIDGLTGIPTMNNYIVRPMLPFSRDEIFQYALQKDIAWREDESNAETKYLRNKIRHDVIPKLKEINPEVLQNFRKTVQNLKGASEILKNHVEEVRASIFKYQQEEIHIPIEELQKLYPLESFLFYLFSPYGFADTNDLILVLDAQSGKQLFSKTHRLLKDRNKLLLASLVAEQKSTTSVFFISEDEKELSSPIRLSIELIDKIEDESRQITYLDKEKLKFPLKLRKWQNGDYFYPFGMQGKKKLSKFFKDEKFSLLSKENQWLLCNADDVIIWIVGKRPDNRFKVTDKTKQILKIECLDA